jgi:hypothetical protein
MQADVSFIGEVTPPDALALDELFDAFVEEGVSARKQKTQAEPGKKDGGLTIGLAITGLVLSGIGSVVSILNYWQSTRPKYKVTVVRGETTVQVENLSPAQLPDAIKPLTATGDVQKTQILITPK